MKFSYDWIQSLLVEPLPAVDTLAEVITFHSSEVESIETVGDDTMLELKVLPDKSSWLLSHRGLAKELSVILRNPLRADPFKNTTILATNNSDRIRISLETPVCDFYSAALLTGVTVGPSPDWLKARLATIGQRSINNIVDATNFVMFELGQPLHAFDAGKLGTDSGLAIAVRAAKSGETIVALTGESYQLSDQDTLIVDGVTGAPIGIAGVKGGQQAAVTPATTSIVLESAHFDRFAIRKTAKRLRLLTDASKRYENGIARGVAPIAMNQVIALITEIAGGEVVATSVVGAVAETRPPVSVSLKQINSVLGLTLASEAVTNIIDRFDYQYKQEGDRFIITPPFERDDLHIAEDLIEEIGRMHGLHTIASIPPQKTTLSEFNTRFYYAEKIRTALVQLGFSEIYTSSFRNKDIVTLENALATDKGCLRSTLVQNLSEARSLNISHRDLLGLSAIKIFEIGTVFTETSEEYRVAFAVQTGTTYKAKLDEPVLLEALSAVVAELGLEPHLIHQEDGIIEFSLDACLGAVLPVFEYIANLPPSNVTYKPFSVYPAVSRDVAMWMKADSKGAEVAAFLASEAGELCVRVTHIDTFTREDKVSQAFRLVFQSKEKTLTDAEVQVVMDRVYAALAAKGWEVR